MSSKRDRHRKFTAQFTEQDANVAAKGQEGMDKKGESKGGGGERPAGVKEERREDKRNWGLKEEKKGSGEGDNVFFNTSFRKYSEFDRKEDGELKLKGADLLQRQSERPKLKKKISADPSGKRRGSMRKNVFDGSLFTDNLALGDSLFMPNKLNRNKSSMPRNEMQFDVSSSEISDPEIKQLKRRAVICCKYTTE